MMKTLKKSLIKLLWVAFGLVGSFQVCASELSELLKKSDHVLLMRHAIAPGIGDPAGYKLQDCKTQRNLDATGRAQAQKTGQWLKAQGVGNALVFSSAWCRCKETAENLAFGTPTLETSLNSFFDDMRQGPQSNANLQKFIANQLKTKGDRALILVTHQVNMTALTGAYPAMGEGFLVNRQARLLARGGLAV